MYQELLQKTGLSLNEARVYEALLYLGEANVNILSIKSKVHRRNVYDSLNKLMEKGLASETFVKMKRLYSTVQPEAEAYLFKGIEGFKNYLQLILEQKQTVYFIGAKAFWLDPRLQYYLIHFDKERKKQGITFMHLFDYEVKEQKPEILTLVGKPYKFLPKKYSSATAVDIFGDYVVTFVGVKAGELYEEPLQFVLKNKLLAEGYRKFFQCMWDNC
jgi:predicted DNA-binding transcriptional regulator